MPDVAGVVLAAGAGRRFGMPKALISHQGSLLVERATQVLAEGGCEPIVVVLGAAAIEVRSRADLTGAIVVDNPDWPSGMGSSLRTALETLLATSDDIVAALIIPVDMPGITVPAVRRVARLAAPEALAAASHQGHRSHPVLLGRDHWPHVRDSASGDAGARGYLRARDVSLIDCDDISEGFDVDYPDDLPRD